VKTGIPLPSSTFYLYWPSKCQKEKNSLNAFLSVFAVLGIELRDSESLSYTLNPE
jgi:hypothetical protein